MKALRLALAILSLAPVAAQSLYTGALDPKLSIVSYSWGTFLFHPATAAQLRALPGDSHPENNAWSGIVPEFAVPVIIAEPTLYADVARDGKFATAVPLEPDLKERTTSSACFDVPLESRNFSTAPVCVRLRAGTSHRDGSRSVDLAVFPWVTGTVAIGPRRIQIGYEYDRRHDSVDPLEGWLGLREAREGAVDFRDHSPEVAYAEKETVVFRAGDLYLSTESADLARRRVVLRTHPAHDYIRVELVPGATLPSLHFTDLNGRAGSLRAYRGKYLLIDVWTPTCAPCLAEFDLLKDTLARFGGGKFALLGLLGEAGQADARRVEREHGLTWPTAASPRSVDYAFKRLRIASWPTHILLDPQGRIVSAAADDLRGEALVRTLERLLQ